MHAVSAKQRGATLPSCCEYRRRGESTAGSILRIPSPELLFRFSPSQMGAVMLAEQILREGDPERSLARLQDQVRKDPSNLDYRVFLFQLLAILGQWDRAFTQLRVAGEMDAGTLAMVQTYREALRCEALRRAVFSGKGTPMVFGKPARWLALLIEALRLTAEGKLAAAQPLRDEAFDLAPAVPGAIDGQPFQWIADADPRLGPVLEAVINGVYYWVPVARVKEVCIEEPTDLRDLVWLPARITWANGGGTVALIPARYPGSEDSDNPRILLCRRTEWLDQGGGLYFGLGQRMLATDAAEYPLMDTRLISLETPAEADDG